MTFKDFLNGYLNAENILAANSAAFERMEKLIRDENTPFKTRLNAADFEDELFAERELCLKTMLKVERFITENISNPTYREILTHRYIEHWTWDKIAEEMRYSQQHIYRLHKLALKAGEQRLKVFMTL